MQTWSGKKQILRVYSYWLKPCCPQFLAAEEKKEEASAPPAEDTGDVDDLVRFCD